MNPDRKYPATKQTHEREITCSSKLQTAGVLRLVLHASGRPNLTT